jgi:hypothetical protein
MKFGVIAAHPAAQPFLGKPQSSVQTSAHLGWCTWDPQLDRTNLNPRSFHAGIVNELVDSFKHNEPGTEAREQT